VGDLHGQFQALQALLKHVAFASGDRLLSVGDLGDRGPQSKEVFDFFRQTPDVYAVKGNHDEMLQMLAEYRTKHTYMLETYSEDFLKYGRWADILFRTGAQGRKWVQDTGRWISRLPLAIVVGKGTPGRYQVVHTEFLHRDPDARIGFFGFPVYDQPYHKEVTDEQIESWPFEEQGLYQAWKGAFLWKTDILCTKLFLKQQQQGHLSPIYSGHTAFKCGHPVRIGQQILLDTGAGYLEDPKEDYRLSMIETGSQAVHQIDRTGAFHTAAVKTLA
jgi:hypothetical protein